MYPNPNSAEEMSQAIRAEMISHNNTIRHFAGKLTGAALGWPRAAEVSMRLRMDHRWAHELEMRVKLADTKDNKVIDWYYSVSAWQIAQLAVNEDALVELVSRAYRRECKDHFLDEDGIIVGNL